MLEEIIDKLNFKYVPVEENSYEKILNLFDKNILYEPLTSNEFLYLGVYYKVNKNDSEAIKFYVKSAEMNNMHAMYNLGNYYDKVKDYVKSKEYYIKASELGNTSAMINLGTDYYYKGKYVKAKEYYIKASELGNGRAMGNLGKYYETIEKDYNKAKEYYIKSLESGNTLIIGELARYYFDVEKNYDKVKECYLTLYKLDQYNAICLYNLGYVYEIEKDYNKAIEYYIKASELNHNDARKNLGYLYENIEQNYVKALEYYKLSYESGDFEVFDNIIKLFKKLEKIEEAIIFAYDNKNNEMVFNLLSKLPHPINNQYKEQIYKIAETLELEDNVVTMINLGNLYRDEKDYIKAKEYYLRASELGNTSAMNHLGHFYEDIEKDYDKSLEYYKLVYECGHDNIYNIIRIFEKLGKLEEAIFFAYNHKEYDTISKLLNRLSYPIEEQYKEQIYKIIETFEFKEPTSINVIKIFQDALMVRQKTLCQIAYYYKKNHI